MNELVEFKPTNQPMSHIVGSVWPMFHHPTKLVLFSAQPSTLQYIGKGKDGRKLPVVVRGELESDLFFASDNGKFAQF